MRSLGSFLSLAVTLGLVLAAPSASGAPGPDPSAQVDGDAAAAVLPSVANSRIVRAEATLVRAGVYADANQRNEAAKRITVARARTTQAWNAAKWLIVTTPPSSGGDGVGDGTAAGAGPYAGPEDTAFAVLSLQHDLVAGAVQMIVQADGKNKVLRKAWVDAIVAGQVKRKTAIAFIHKRKKPNIWGTVMPGLVPELTDEIKMINGKIAAARPKGALRKSMLAARSRALKARKLINKYWPPVPGD